MNAEVKKESERLGSIQIVKNWLDKMMYHSKAAKRAGQLGSEVISHIAKAKEARQKAIREARISGTIIEPLTVADVYPDKDIHESNGAI